MARLGDLVGDIPPGGRLTLTSGTPVTTSDVTAATSVYYTPYVGNKISLYNGWEWIFHEFSELSLSLSGYTADTNYDIFVYNNGGVLTLESVAWASATARATNIVRVDGVYVKDGDSTRRYLGTIRTTSTTGQCADSTGKRFCWNLYNALERYFYITGLAEHTYSTSTARPWNNDTAYRVGLVTGLPDRPIHGALGGQTRTGTGHQYCIGIDSITTYHDNFIWPLNDLDSVDYEHQGTSYGVRIISTPGYHYLQVMEISFGTATYLQFRFWGWLNG